MENCIEEFNVELDIRDCNKLYDYATCQTITRPKGGEWDKEMLKQLGRTTHVQDTDENLMLQIRKMDKAINDTGLLQKKAKESDSSSKEECIFDNDYDAFDESISLPPRVLPMYRPGDIVRGNVILRINQTVQADALKVNFIGQGTVCIRIYHRYGYYDDIRHEKYVDDTQILWKKTGETMDEEFSNLIGSSPREGNAIAPGAYKWPFEFKIPLETSQSTPNLHPGSSNYCFIMYRLKAKIDSGKSLGRGDVVTHKGIWLEKEHDIAEDPENLKSVHQQEELETGLLIKSGKITVHASLPRAGFVKGESIPLSLEIDNNTSGSIDKITAAIVMHGKFRLSDSKITLSHSINVKSEKKCMESVGSGMCPKIQWDLPWDFSQSSVDSNLMPTGILDDCKLIDCRYDVIVKITRSGLHRNIKLQLPIYVGSYNSKEETMYPKLD